MAEDKTKGLTVGSIIAFIAPGFVAFNAAAYKLPDAAAWLRAASTREQSVGLFLFVSLASLSLGVIVSGLRALALDWLCVLPVPPLQKFGMGVRITPPKIDFGALTDESTLAAFEAINEQYYRYYQFYANMFVAVVILLVVRRTTSLRWDWATFALLLVLLLVLFLSARDSLRRYCTAATALMPQRKS